MTDQHQLPLELHRLEQDLTDRPRSGPPTELRQRVIQDVRGELRRNGSRSRWAFAAAVAAAALVWINLSLSATLATNFNHRSVRPGPPVGQITERLHRLLPEVSEEEVLRQTILLQAPTDLPAGVLLPAIPPASRCLENVNNLPLQGN